MLSTISIRTNRREGTSQLPRPTGARFRIRACSLHGVARAAPAHPPLPRTLPPLAHSTPDPAPASAPGESAVKGLQLDRESAAELMGQASTPEPPESGLAPDPVEWERERAPA